MTLAGPFESGLAFFLASIWKRFFFTFGVVTMLATHSAESRILQRLTRLDASADFLAGLASVYLISGASSAKLSIAFRGGKALDNQTAQELLNLLDRCIALVNDASPLPLRFDNPGVIKSLLDARRTGDLEIRIVLNGKSDVERRLAVITEGDSWKDYSNL
jgi:hypothetical protein